MQQFLKHNKVDTAIEELPERGSGIYYNGECIEQVLLPMNCVIICEVWQSSEIKMTMKQVTL